VVISADAQGRAVISSATIDLPPSTFTSHFPSGVVVGWTQPGAVVVQSGLINPTQSALPGASGAAFTTAPGAPTQPPPVLPDTLTFSPDSAVWSFTPDGGLHAEGTIAPAPLRWGARDASHIAHVTGNFTSASGHVPGNVLRGALATTSNDNRPGELLLSGHGRPGDATYGERPASASYLSGFADYAGLNFRVATDGGQTATSLIGDATVGPYSLQATSKYYARNAGISGIHEAVTSSFASLSGALAIYGFPLSLNNYQLSFLDNTPHDSLVSGTVNVPGARGTPGFAQPFTKLMFDSKGQPTEITLPQPNNFEHNLSYWNVHLHPLSAEFQPKPSDPGKYALIFGGEVLLAGVLKDPLRGGLGFFNDGSLVAASDGFPGVNSRLKPPSLTSLHGTRSALDATRPGFSVHPVSDVYFNDPNAPGAPDAGFAAFAGTVNVPFFQAIKVHVLARANGVRTSVRAGWSEGGNDFFNQANFDSSNRGFPSGSTAADYENDAEPAGAYFDPTDPAHQQRNPYNPTANQSWLGFVDFSLPITWDAAQRRFLSSIPEQRDFLVLNSQRVLQQLTPSGADIRFGLQFNGLPRLNLAALVIDDQEATSQLIQFIPNGSRLVSGLQAFDTLLQGNSDQLIANGLDFAIDQFLDDLLNQGGPLHDALSAADAVNGIGTAGSAHFTQLSAALRDRLAGIIGTVNDANSVIKDVNDALITINGGLATADTLLAKDAQGKRGSFVIQTINIATSLGLPAQDAAQVSDFINTIINGDLAPTLDDIQSSINDVHSLSTSAQGLVGNVQSITQSALDAVNVAGSLPDQVLGAMSDYFKTANDPTGRLLAEVAPTWNRVLVFPDVNGASVTAPTTGIGPNMVAAFDLAGDSLDDLAIATEWDDPPDSTHLAGVQTSDLGMSVVLQPVAENGPLTHGNRARFRSNLPWMLGALRPGTSGTEFITRPFFSFPGFAPGPTLTGLATNATWAWGEFIPGDYAQFIFYAPGASTLQVPGVAEPTPFAFGWTAGSTFDLGQPIAQVIVVPNTTGALLLVIFGDGSTAATYDFDGLNAPVARQTLAAPAGMKFSLAGALGGGNFLLLNGPNGGQGNSTGWQNWSLNGAQHTLTASGAIPAISTYHARANVLLFAANPDTSPGAPLVQSLRVGEWSTGAAVSSTGLQVTYERSRGSALGLGDAVSTAVNSPTALLQEHAGRRGPRGVRVSCGSAPTSG
jgi:hypothetical protein